MQTKRLDDLVGFFETLTPQSLERFPEFYAANAWFKDPFNEVRGVASIQRIFTHMYKEVEAPQFVVSERVVDAHGALLVWEFSFRLRGAGTGTAQCIRGASHLKFDAEGKVRYHRDYWDAAEELYMKLPLIGTLMRVLRNKLTAHKN